MIPVVAIVGRTNVGKSTLFNRVIQKRFAVTSIEPETTRDRLYADTEWQGKEFIIIDTAGLNIETPEETPENIKQLIEGVKTQVYEAINEADLLLFSVSADEGLTSRDKEIADIIRKSGKPTILVVNKVDNQEKEMLVDNFLVLGIGKPSSVSAISGRKSGDLLDRIVSELKKIKPKREKIKSDIDVAIIGRPNVGKSTLVNSLVGRERVVVNEIPGTTVDSIDVFLKYQDKTIKIVDTAGIRRRGKIKVGVEKFSVLRAVKAIARADITLLVLDADEGITNQDLHIAQFALEAGRGLILVINKWDLKEKDITMDNFLSSLKNRISFLPWSPVIFISALTGKNVQKIFDIILEVKFKRTEKISTRKLNQIISDAVSFNPPKTRGEVQPKIYFSTQIVSDTPKFILKVNDSSLFHFSYLRYLEKKIRESFDFTGTPIKIELKSNRDNK